MYKQSDVKSARSKVSYSLKNKKKKVPKGYHRMPDGSLMRGTRHKSK